MSIGPVGNGEESPEMEQPVAMGSLAGRIKARREELESETTRVFPLPAYEDVLGVELRMLSWERLRHIASMHERERNAALRELYTAADSVLYASEQMHGIDPNGGTAPITLGWLDVAREAGHKLPEDATLRQAMLALIRDVGVVRLYADWQAWLSGERQRTDEGVVRDFGTTESRNSPTG
jgi:hypothetical protein